MPIFGRKRKRQEVDLEARSPQLGIKFKDLMVLDQLRRVGADFSKPRHVIYYLYFKQQSQAVAASEEAAARGFSVEVREPLPDYPEDWALVCELHDHVLGLEEVRDNTDMFEDLASAHNGVFDGWEASAD